MGTLLGDDVLATALLDRLLHHAEVITINGRCYRKSALDWPRVGHFPTIASGSKVRAR